MIISNSVTSIGDKAFYHFSNLAEIVIPNSVTSIEEGAFYFCKNLTDIYIYNDNIILSDFLYAHKNSTTQEYANTYRYKFSELPEDNLNSFIEDFSLLSHLLSIIQMAEV